MKRMTEVTRVRPWTSVDEAEDNARERLKAIPDKTQVFEIDGPMFFATSDIVASIPIKHSSKIIILRMRNVPTIDVSALQTLTKVYDFCVEKNISVIFSHVNEQPLSVMKKVGFYDRVGRENFADNIDEALEIAKKL
jgi:SulP family sulfate permease